MHRTTFVNARIFDGIQGDYLDDSVVVVEADRIVSVERNRSPSIEGDVVDVGGKTLMPGLIDAHCHVLGASVKVADLETQPLTLRTAVILRGHAQACDCMKKFIRVDVVADLAGGDCRLEEPTKRGTDSLFEVRAQSSEGRVARM